MSFITHTMAWIKGEIFEAYMLIAWGTALLAMAALFWFFARTPSIQSLFLPFTLVGLLWGAAGAISLYNNTGRLTAYEQAYRAAPDEFVQVERKRVDGFIWAYKYLLVAWSAAIVLGLFAFMLWGGPLGRGIGIGLILLGMGGLLVDHTSEQNAHDYDAMIRQQIVSASGR